MDNIIRHLSRSDSEIAALSCCVNPELCVSKELARLSSARDLSTAGQNSKTPPKSLIEFLCSEDCAVFRLWGTVPVKVSSTSILRQRSKSDDDVDKVSGSENSADMTRHRKLRRTRSFDYIYIPNLPYMPEVSRL